MTNAAIYLRISQDSTGEGLGVSRQLEDCTALAETLGWPVVEVYRDNDVSAASGKPRPAYRQLLADIQSGAVDAVVAWHADRLYRRMRDLEELLEIVKANGTQIATVKAGTIDLTTDSGQMIAEILASVASYEGRAKATRWKRSWRQGREAGKPARTGSRLFGYTRAGELIPEEATITRRMAADILDGGSILGVSRWLDEEGILTTRGTTWRPGTVRQYLANPRIAAWSTLGGDIIGEGQWEPLLDRDTWELVRALLASRARAYVPRKSVLNGLLFCGACGTRMVTSSQRQQRTYRCPNRPGMNGCGGVSGNAAPIEEVVEAYAETRLADPRVRKRIAELRAQPPGTHEVAALELRIAELEHQLDEPGVPVASILRAIDRAKERQADLLSRVQASVPVILPAADASWPEDLRRRRALIDLVVERVELLPASQPSRFGFDPERVKIVGS